MKAWPWDTEVQKAESGTRPLLYWEGAHSSEMGQTGGPQRRGLQWLQKSHLNKLGSNPGWVQAAALWAEQSLTP